MRLIEIGWEQTEPLRAQVLGWPAGPVPGDVDPGSTHLAVTDRRSSVVAVLSYCPHPWPERPTVAASYFWAMAVRPSDQRTGLGRRLIEEVIRRCRALDQVVLWADARSTAVGFYEACGARVLGEPYLDDVTGLQDRRIIFELAVAG